MRLVEYLKGQREWLVAQTAAILLVNLILFVSTPLDKALGEIFYIDVLWVGALSAGAVFHFCRHNRVYGTIRREAAECESMEQMMLIQNDLGRETVMGRGAVGDFLSCAGTLSEAKEAVCRQKLDDMGEYVTRTAHDLKVNIAACKMAAGRMEQSEDSRRLLYQLEQMRFRIDQMLSVTRANNYSEDVMSEQLNLAELVREAIRDNREFFMEKGIEINSVVPPSVFVGDKKWSHYIISQILNNCSKYTGSGGIVCLSATEDDRGVHLHIRDNGIGIPANEQGRIFDKGFTGSNGRIHMKSTGMGMYYAGKMADILGIGLKVESEVGDYTEFTVSFYKLPEYLRTVSVK